MQPWQIQNENCKIQNENCKHGFGWNSEMLGSKQETTTMHMLIQFFSS